MSEVKATRAVVVRNPPIGLHLRPAEQFAKLASQFDAKIEVIKENDRVDAKSVLNILTLAAGEGTKLELEAVGHDAEAALDALVKLVENDFQHETDPRTQSGTQQDNASNQEQSG